MKRSQLREIAFTLIYSSEIQKEMNEEQLNYFIEENNLENKEEIAKKIKNRLYKMESHETEVKIMDQETPFLDDDIERFLYSYE